MRYLIALMLVVIGTGCETGKSGAEISALGESLVSEQSTPVVAEDVPATPAIDYGPRVASTYANAVNACQAESRSLCTRSQLLTASQTGDVAYSYGVLATYWMQQEPTPMRNVMQILNGDFSYIQDSSGSRKFYCCR